MNQNEPALHYVEIVESKTQEVVKRMGPTSESTAIKIENGVHYNLNHDMYFTRIVPAELAKEQT